MQRKVGKGLHGPIIGLPAAHGCYDFHEWKETARREARVAVRKRRVRRIAVAIAFVFGFGLGYATRAQADVSIGANFLSLHSDSTREWFTPGIYARVGDPWFVEAGAYRSSQGFPAVHAGFGYRYPIGRFDLALGVGAVYGYRDQQGWYYPDGSKPRFDTYGPKETRAYAIPSAGFAIDDRTTARAFVIPPLGGCESWAVSFALEWKLK
jgi:hypothetical protein